MKLKFILGMLAAGALASSAHAQTVVTLITNTTPDQIGEPHSVVSDDRGTLYFSDSSNHRILSYNPESGLVANVAGVNGQFGTNNGPGFFARFFSPRGIVFARGGLVVADSGNHSLRLITRLGERTAVVTNLVGASDSPGYVDGDLAVARFNTPSGLAADASGVYIADFKNNAVRKLVGNTVSTLATNFNGPTALAVGDNGNLFVADSGNNAIKIIARSGVVTLLAGSSVGVNGTNDSYFAEEALFNTPNGLLWLGETNGLVVSDTGNHTLRRVFYDGVVEEFFPDLNGYSVETYAGSPRLSGHADGNLLSARFNSPIGLTLTQEGALAIADAGNKVLRLIQRNLPQPPVRNPRIGWVDFFDDSTDFFGSRLVNVPPDTFNNDVLIAIIPELPSIETFFVVGRTPLDQFQDTVPSPNRSSDQAPPYQNFMSSEELRGTPSLDAGVSDRSDITIKAISFADGRRPSEVVSARFQFKTANPTIIGDNAAAFQLSTITSNAVIWFTLDGSVPSNGPPSLRYEGGNVPVGNVLSNFTFRARAFRQSYKPSSIVTRPFDVTNYVPNRISFGFESGEASSVFVASPGQSFLAPVTLALLPGQKVYSLQFNITVTNLNGPPVATGQVGFESMLKRELVGFSPPRFETIQPQMFVGFDFDFTGTNSFNIFTNLVVTNATRNILGLGWIERFGNSRLYPTALQDLVKFSQAHDNVFVSTNGRSILGAYYFTIPSNVTLGNEYQIKISRPSASDDGISSDLVIDTPTNGLLTAVKNVTIGERRYIVGDAAPFRWFNAGDFGDMNLLNSDIIQVFQSAVYSKSTLNTFFTPAVGANPPITSDFFDAMDSSDGGRVLTTNLRTITNSVVSTNLITSNVVITNLTMLVTNVYFVTNSFLTNLTVVSTNVPSSPSQIVIIPVIITNFNLSTVQVLTNVSTNLLQPVYVTNLTVVTNLIVYTNSLLVTNLLAITSPVLVTNSFTLAYSIVTTNVLVTPINILRAQVTLFSTNTYSGQPIPSNGFLGFTTNQVFTTERVPEYRAIYDGNDSRINEIKSGDGELNVDDVFVTFRRSLDPTLKWYARFWSNGSRTAAEVTNLFRGQPNRPAESFTLGLANSPADALDGPAEPPSVMIAAEHGEFKPGQMVTVPIVAQVKGRYPIRVMMLNLDVVPLNGAPPLTKSIKFTASKSLGQAAYTTSRDPANYASAWLDSSATGISGDNLIGVLTIAMPENVPLDAAYQIKFQHVSASPNGIGLFPKRVKDGVLTVANSTASSWGDSIPDSWRLRYFASTDNWLSHAEADADGDGLSNLAEFKAGTDPSDALSALRLFIHQPPVSVESGPMIRWPTVANRIYVLESSDSLNGEDWTPISSSVGDGNDKAYSDSRPEAGARFYRLRLAQ